MSRPRVWLCVLALSVASAAAAAPSTLPLSVPRVRPLDSWAAMLVARGVQQSPTLRSLVDRLNRSDVIVYIEVGPLQATADGMVRFLAATKYGRLVRVSLSHRLTHHELLGLLGHELHHAMEIADHPDIRDEQALRRFYQAHGEPGCGLGTYESEGARSAGRKVRAEIG